MPFDGHAFLVNQGWSGTGAGLREGAISRPITAPQKKNLAGIGKDRDEALPFWDHDEDDVEDGPQPETKCTRASTLELRRTSTGILSNRPHIDGTPVSSGATTPTPSLDDAARTSAPRLSLLALAKREAARRGLYARFFRGPILGPDDVQSEMAKTESIATQMPSHPDDDMERGPKEKRKIDARAEEDTLRMEKLAKEARKRERRLRKDAEKAARKVKRHKEKHKAKDGQDEDIASSSHPDESILSTFSQEQGSGLLISTSTGEVPRARREEKKKKQFKVASVDEELDAKPPVSADERTLDGEARGKLGRKDSQNRSRKRRRRDQSP